jgi:hypothetical protein
MIVRVITALAVFWLAYDGGSYDVVARQTLAIAVWWAILLLVAFGPLAAWRPRRLALVPVASVAGLCVVTGASIAWAPSAEKAFLELSRGLLYLGVLLLGALAASTWGPARLGEGVAIGIAAVGFLALAERLLPGVLPASDVVRFLPSARNRLSFPVDYWNGLAVLLALGAALLVGTATTARPPVWRGLAVAPLPALAGAIYLTSSRGGVLAAALGVVVAVALSRRWAALGAALVATAGATLAVAVLVDRPAVVDGPLGSAAAESQGRSAAVLIAVVCAASGLVYALGCTYLRPLPALRPAVWAGAAAIAGTLVAAGIASAHPVRAFETFRAPPAALDASARAEQSHLLSGGGSGRWQFWSAAVDQFEANPILGGGTGSFEAWWARHGPLAYFVRDAHSLYVETLGELGLVGFVFLLGFVGGGLALATATALRAPPELRPFVAGLAGAFAAYAVAAGIDWMWELTVVSAVGIACLGFVLGTQLGEQAPGHRIRSVARALGAVACATVIACQAIPLLVEAALDRSRAAARDARLDDALAAADDARAVQPWASAPYLQLGLVEEQLGNLSAARGRLAQAIRRDPEDWRLRLIAARLATKDGAIRAARRELARARALNPRSPLFAKSMSESE